MITTPEIQGIHIFFTIITLFSLYSAMIFENKMLNLKRGKSNRVVLEKKTRIIPK